MTPEQLDEIEKRWAGYLEKDEVERRFLFDQWWDKRDFWDMTKALRDAWARCETLRDLADEKAHAAGLFARRMEEAQKARSEARAAATRQTERLVQSEELTDRLHKERDAALAEVERRTDWYQQRFNALRTWVENEVAPLSPEVAKRYWNIVANGSPSPHESADWSATLHDARLRAHFAGVRADNAERREAHLKQELETMRAEVERLTQKLKELA